MNTKNRVIRQAYLITQSFLILTLVITSEVFAQDLELNETQLSKVPELEKIRSQFNNQQVIGLIIELNVEFLPEGELSLLQLESQRKQISEVQRGVIDNLSGVPITNIKRYSSIPALALRTDDEGFLKLINHPQVRTVQLDELAEPTLSSTTEIVGANDAWDLGITGANQSVVILDTGVDSDHSFLRNKVVAEACFSSNSFQSSSLCPNGRNQQFGSGSGIDCDGSINGCDHGTHVAGIAAGTGDNFHGVARGANLISIQVFSKIQDSNFCGSNSPCLGAFYSDLIAALDYVHTTLKNDHQISSVNMSLGGGFYTQSCDHVNSAGSSPKFCVKTKSVRLPV